MLLLQPQGKKLLSKDSYSEQNEILSGLCERFSTLKSFYDCLPKVIKTTSTTMKDL